MLVSLSECQLDKEGGTSLHVSTCSSVYACGNETSTQGFPSVALQILS